MQVSQMWATAFAALWVLIGTVALAQWALLRYALRLERELLDASDGPEVGSEAPRVELRDLAGEPQRLTPSAGRKMALFFVSPSCSACGQVTRGLQSLPEMDGFDFRVVCQASEAAARRYAERLDMDVPVLPDPDGASMRAFQVTGIPFALLLDSKGIVERKGVPATYRDLLEFLGTGDGLEETVPVRRGAVTTGLTAAVQGGTR